MTGSGKSTLAARLSRASGIPWHSVDDLSFEADWKQVPLELQRERIQAICDQESWILDTAYGTWLDLPLARAEMIVGLDYPRGFSLQRLVRRTLARLSDRRPICNGNHETLRGLFSRKSIVLWHFQTFSRKRARMRRWQEETGGRTVMVFRRASDLEQWCLALEQHQAKGGMR